MEPRIQYTKTAQGVNIAYCTIGTGPPLVVFAPMGHSHLQLEWQYAPLRAWYERLAKTRSVIRWDFGGQGLSTRSVSDFSEDTLVGEIETIASQLELEEFALLAGGSGAVTAVPYAVRHPAQVTHLIISQPWTKLATPVPADLAEQDWRLFTEGVALRAIGWSHGDAGADLAAFMRRSIDKETWQTMAAQTLGRDITDLLPAVQTPTLIISGTGAIKPPYADPSDFAARIPESQVVFIDGGGLALWEGEDMYRAIVDFLGDAPEAASAGSSEVPEGTAIILFADIADSTALTERLGDTAFREKARKLDVVLGPAIVSAGGTVVEGKLLGDGLLATFASARQAIEAARLCRDASVESGLKLHVGNHAGDVIREASNVFGGAVNLAARIADASAPGEILVSDTLRGLARTSAGVAFEDRGEHGLKGIDEPQRLWAVEAL